MSITMSTAQKMLDHFVSKQCKTSSLSVLYCITGVKNTTTTTTSSSSDGEDNDDEGNWHGKKMCVELVSGEELDSAKKQYIEIWNVHVYSVQPGPIKESSTLYNSDYQAMRDHLADYSKWNTISCDLVSCDNPRPNPTPKPLAAAWNSNNCGLDQESSNGRQHSVVAHGADSTPAFGSTLIKKEVEKKKKPPSKPSVSNFFNKKPTSSNKITSDSTTMSKTSTNKVATSSDVPTITPKPSKDPSENKVSLREKQPLPLKQDIKITSTSLQDSDFEDESDDRVSTLQSKSMKSRQRKKLSTKRKGNNNGSHDTNDGRKKRRRVHGMSSSSSSEGEEENVIDTKNDDKPTVVTLRSPKKSHGRKRKRVRRLESKMFLDTDGSMVTVKEWKEVSTDASSSSDDGPSGVSTTVKKAAAPKMDIQSPSKRTKQSSLMSFFKK